MRDVLGRWLAVGLAVAVGLAGCATPRRMHPEELTRLHGYRQGDEVVIRTASGIAVPFDEETSLGLVLWGGEEIVHRYGHVEIIDDVFYGIVAGSDVQVAIALGDIAYARIWPEEHESMPGFAVMVLTMWLVIGVAGLFAWLIYRNSDFDDAEVRVVITHR